MSRKDKMLAFVLVVVFALMFVGIGFDAKSWRVPLAVLGIAFGVTMVYALVAVVIIRHRNRQLQRAEGRD